MVSANILIKNLINVNNVVVEEAYLYDKSHGVRCLRVKVRPKKHDSNRCPHCHKVCTGYDRPYKRNKIWRGLDAGGIIVELESETHRVVCPEHKVVTAAVPWAYYNSSFTKDFDMTAAWMSKYLSIKAVSEYLRIDWKTVGNCINRASREIEKDRSKRLDNLVNIGIDETSYSKGHKYITVVVNHDTNTVVWVHEGHGKQVLEKFYNSLTPEQLSSIKVVSGDGARWITSCVNEFTPECQRCIDPFHVVQWVTDALDKLRIEKWHEYNNRYKALLKGSDQEMEALSEDEKKILAAEYKDNASKIKSAKYLLGRGSANLSEAQSERLELLRARDKQLSAAYTLKESIRIILKARNVERTSSWLDLWCGWAAGINIDIFTELSEKIQRHKQHILNTIKLGLSNARVEAMNNKIKLVIRKAYGFRNMRNMMDMIYLVCSNIDIPLPNRKQVAAEAL